jgi:hypothetical protein
MQPPERQPLGFWTVRAGEAIRARTRGALAEIGMTQPEWWLLHQLSLHQAGVEHAAVIATIGTNDTPAAVEEAIGSATARGWATQDHGHLHATAAGAEQLARGAVLQQQLQDERMQGVSHEDFATTIRVLQRTITNVGGEAWHW